jgi:hypothetical protein
MQCLYRSEKKLRNRIMCGQILEEDATIVKFSDLLCSGLIERDCNNTAVVRHCVSGTETLLARIERDGEINLPVTEENKSRGRLTGQPIQRKCFVCRMLNYSHSRNPPCAPVRARTDARTNPSTQRATQLRSVVARVYAVSIQNQITTTVP